MNKKLIIILKSLIFCVVIYFFVIFINQDDFIKIIRNVKIKNLILVCFIFFLIPLITTLRWFLIVRYFSKVSFFSFFKNIISGFSVNLITSSTLAIEAVKFLKIKKEIGNKKSLILIFLDKIITLILKIIFISIIFYIFINFVNKEIYVNNILLITFSFLMILILFNLGNIIKKILNYKNNLNYKFSKKICHVLKENLLNLIFLNLTVQLINILVYYLIFISLSEKISFFELSLFIPFVEILSLFQFIIIGMKEISTVLILSQLEISKEIAFAGAMIYLFIDYIVIISISVLINLKSYYQFLKKNFNFIKKFIN